MQKMFFLLLCVLLLFSRSSSSSSLREDCETPQRTQPHTQIPIIHHHMTDIRSGLSAYTTARANAAAITPLAPPKTNGFAMPGYAAAAPTAAGSSAAAVNTPRNGSGVALLSSTKRDLTSAAASDQPAPASHAGTATKPKITYALPHQNMEEGHFYIVLGEDVDVSTQRFKMLSLLGEGTFGKVVECWDRKQKKYCAVKIVRNIPKYTRDAKVEIDFMERLRAADAHDVFPLMKIQRHFSNDSGHVCIVMNKYGPCLLDHLQKHGPLPHRFLAEILFQCGTALDFFHSEMRLIHTDLKPENILLENGSTVLDPISNRQVPVLPCKIRICDLGGCCDERHSRTAIVSTRHYRAPEVILGLGWMFSADMWSMGCIAYELCTGRLLYDTHDNLEHLHLFEKTLGKRIPSDWPHRSSEETKPLFSSTTGSPRSLVDTKSLARVSRARPITDVISDELLRDLIMGLLQYDRTRRYTARQMTTHPYILKYFPEAQQHPQHPANRGPLPPPPPA